jgi:putative transposase
MKTIRVFRLHPSPALAARLKAAQMEAAAVWNTCCDLHQAARQAHTLWPGQHEMQHATMGRFALHSQSVQAIFRAFLGTIDTTRQLRLTHRSMRVKYPWRTKRFYPVHWPAEAVSKQQGRVVLPMGTGRKSLVLPLALSEEAGACTLVWNHGFELHVCVEVQQAEVPAGTWQATVDLGEIHLAAVTTNTGHAPLRHRTRYPLAQATAAPAGGEAGQKAIPLQEVLASLEETATRQADGLLEV